MLMDEVMFGWVGAVQLLNVFEECIAVEEGSRVCVCVYSNSLH